MSPSVALNAVDVGVDLVWRRRHRGAGKMDRFRRLTGSTHTRTRSIFSDVSFKVRRGECVGITIPGRGNDLLLGQVLAGRIDPDSGTVRRTGRWIFAPGGPDLLANGLTLRQNVHLVAGLLGYPGRLPTEIETGVLESLNAVPQRNRPTDGLPLPLLRIVTTVTALHLPADVYCLAGGLRGGTQEERRAMRRLMKERVKDGATVIAIGKRLPGIPVDRTIEVAARKRRR